MMIRFRFAVRPLAMVLAALFPLCAGAQIRTDGSLGTPAQTLAGPRFLIPESIGKLAGANLFHSFESFNIRSGESANFTTATPGIANVISRVSGGSVSEINGRLRMTPVSGAPNFFLINPAGVHFGTGATLDVPGAFHVSTADSVKFPDGEFHADPSRQSTFSSAGPEAFGFFGAKRASIRVNDGASLTTRATKPISLVAGDITIDGGKVSTEDGGDIRIVATGQKPAQIGFAGILPATDGNLAILNGGAVTSSTGTAVDAGAITIGAGNVTVDGGCCYSSIASDSWAGVGNAGNIDISATGDLSLVNGGTVSSTVKQTTDFSRLFSYLSSQDLSQYLPQMLAGNFDFSLIMPRSSGNAGAVRVRAGKILVDEQGGGTTGISTSIDGAGNAGSIDVVARGSLTLIKGSIISDAESSSSGKAGSVKVSADSISIDGQGSLFDFPRISSDTRGSGNAGNVEVDVAGRVSLVNGAQISSSTFSSGNAGSVSISAREVAVDAQDIPVFTGIFSEASSGSTGKAGSVKVTTSGDVWLFNQGHISTSSFGAGDGGSVEISSGGSVSTIQGSVIFSNTFQTGNAGSVKVSAARIVIDAPEGWSYTGIFSDTGKSGNAGSVSVQATESISILRGRISSRTQGEGVAGLVSVNAPIVQVDGPNSSINASANRGSSGQTGNVVVSATDRIVVSQGGELAIRSDATVAAPARLSPSLLSVAAPRIIVRDAAKITSASTGNVPASNIGVSFTDRLSLDAGSIVTSANLGNGGAISVQGGGLVDLMNSQITTSVAGLSGNGGDIRIGAKALAMRTGFIQANTAAENASGGNVGIDVQTLVPSGNSLFLGGQTPYDFRADVFGFNVIQAAAPTGLSGTVSVTAPSLDISGTLTGLKAKTIDGGGLGRSPCRISGGSSLVQAGRGGFAPSARELLGAAPMAAAKAVDLPSTSVPLARSLAGDCKDA